MKANKAFTTSPAKASETSLAISLEGYLPKGLRPLKFDYQFLSTISDPVVPLLLSSDGAFRRPLSLDMKDMPCWFPWHEVPCVDRDCIEVEGRDQFTNEVGISTYSCLEFLPFYLKVALISIEGFHINSREMVRLEAPLLLSYSVNCSLRSVIAITISSRLKGV